MSKWCCDWFDRMIGYGAQQGFAIVAFRVEERRRFHLQARAFTESQLQSWSEIVQHPDEQVSRLFRQPDGGGVGIAAASTLPMLYCPHCGSDLLKIIKRHRDDFDNLADQQRPIAIG